MDTQTPTYSTWLRSHMEAQGLSQRQLAIRMNPDDPETSRRAVRRYLKGMVPIERTRLLIAAALGTGNDIGPDNESSEDDLLGGRANGAG